MKLVPISFVLLAGLNARAQEPPPAAERPTVVDSVVVAYLLDLALVAILLLLDGLVLWPRFLRDSRRIPVGHGCDSGRAG